MLKPENIRRVPCGAYQQNAYLVCPDGREDAFLIDAGDGLSALQQALRQSARTLAHILLTHGHFDHILAAQPLHNLTGAMVHIHADDAEMLADPVKSAYSPEVCSLSPPVDLPYAPYPAALEVCGCAFDVLHTPGHTKGSVCLYDRASGILFAGDTLFRAGYGRTDLYGGSDRAIAESLRRLFLLPGETRVFCGHGPETTIAAERGRYGL